MHRIAATIALLVCAGVALSASAQDPSKPQSTTTPSVSLPANAVFGGGCPVLMDARQGVWDHTIRVRNGENEKMKGGFGQRISLTLTDIHAGPIVAATVRVLGLSGQNRMLNTSEMSNGAPDKSRVIRLTAFTAARSGATADLYAPGFTAVTSIQLLEVTYADGSTWKINDSNACRVAPDPLMLIAGH